MLAVSLGGTSTVGRRTFGCGPVLMTLHPGMKAWAFLPCSNENTVMGIAGLRMMKGRFCCQ
jgi:hypothetical protein